MLTDTTQKRILIVEICCFIALGLIIGILLPETFFSLFIGFSVIYICVSNLYSYSSYYSKLGHYVLLATTLIMAFCITLNIWQFTSLSTGTLDNPVLNNFDSARYFSYAKYSYQYNSFVDSTTMGYPYLIGCIWRLTGVTIVVPLLLNYFFTISSIMISGILASRLLKPCFPEYDTKTICSITMLLLASCCYYLGNGNVILKEPSLYLGISLCGYALAGLYRNDSTTIKKDIADLCIFCVGSLFVSFNRPGLCLMLTLAILILAFYRSRKNILKALGMIAIVASLWGATFILSPKATEVQASIITQNVMDEGFYDHEESHQAYQKMLPDYFNYPIWKKAILLPLTASVQYFIPFPWGFGKYSSYGFSQFYSQISYPWYIIGGLILFFFFIIWGRNKAKGLFRWGIVCAMCYLTPAFLFAGMVSRYWISFLPLIIPFATFVILELKKKNYHKHFTYWAGGYSFIVITVLISCYYLQNRLL